MSTLSRWLEQGAPFEGLPPLPAPVEKQIADWEAFLNGDSLKQRLVSRYIFEHLFLAHLYFDTDPEPHYFRLIRSRTPPGQPVDLVVSRRPYDDPGVERVYYRLEREQETIVDKTHMPYALGQKRMARWRELFLKSDYRVDRTAVVRAQGGQQPLRRVSGVADQRRAISSCSMKRSSPSWASSRVRSVAGRSRSTSSTITSGCFSRSTATMPQQQFGAFLSREASLLELPTADSGSDAGIVGPWRKYAKTGSQLPAEEVGGFLTRYAASNRRPDLNWIWNGDGRNPNAASDRLPPLRQCVGRQGAGR
jgi:hypothetical protein